MDERQPLLDASNTQRNDDPNTVKQNVVEFNPDGDEDNPRDWTKRYRWCIVLLLCFMAFNVTFTCVGIVPVAGDVIKDLEGHKDRSASVLFVTIWELGEAAGPLFIAPLSEVYGRYLVYNVANGFFLLGIVITILSPNANLLIFARFFTGCAVASNVLNPAIVGDIFQSEFRGSAMSMVMLAPLVGGAIGPVVAGAVAEATGWREVFWIALGMAGLCEIIFLTYFRETYKVTILRRRAAHLRKETGDSSLRTEFDGDFTNQIQTVLKSMLRPAQVLRSSFILQILALWGAVVFTFFYILSTTLPDLLEDLYGLNSAQTGLAFLSFTVGSMFGIMLCNFLVDRIYIKLQERRGEKFHPEGRLPLPILGAFLLPGMVAFYGWTAEQRWPMWCLLLTVVIQGLAVILAIIPAYTYITDAFGLYSASALTAVLVTRCLAGTFLPLATPPLTDALGQGFGYTILGAICLVLAPVPVLVMRYGPHWRQRSSYTRDS